MPVNIPPVSPDRPPGVGSRRRFLVVSDTPEQAQKLQQLLSASGFMVEVASDGKTGFDRFRTSSFDLVITDMLCCGLTGFELCRKIKSTPAGAQVPLILLAQLTDPLDILQGLRCGVDSLVTKPYEPGYLIGLIRHILANHCPRAGKKIMLAGTKLTITSDKEQILDLLLATFEELARANRELQTSQAVLDRDRNRIESYAHLLEARVDSLEEKYTCLLEHTSDAVFVLDLCGTIQEANAHAVKLLRLPADQVLGRCFDDFAPTAELDLDQSMLQMLPVKGSLRIDHLCLRLGDGKMIQVDVSASMFEADKEKHILLIANPSKERTRIEPHSPGELADHATPHRHVKPCS